MTSWKGEERTATGRQQSHLFTRQRGFVFGQSHNLCSTSLKSTGQTLLQSQAQPAVIGSGAAHRVCEFPRPAAGQYLLVESIHLTFLFLSKIVELTRSMLLSPSTPSSSFCCKSCCLDTFASVALELRLGAVQTCTWSLCWREMSQKTFAKPKHECSSVFSRLCCLCL